MNVASEVDAGTEETWRLVTDRKRTGRKRAERSGQRKHGCRHSPAAYAMREGGSMGKSLPLIEAWACSTLWLGHPASPVLGRAGQRPEES